MFFSSDLSVAGDDIFIGTELIQSHGAAGVELLGGDAHLTAQTELSAVGEAGGDVDVHGGTVHLTGEAGRSGGVLRDDAVAVMGGVGGDVGDGIVQTVHHVLGVQELLLGNMPGSLGEVAALALICGFVYLLWRRVITWQIPVSVLGTMAVFAFVVALASGSTGPVLWQFPLFHVLAGGALLGAIFMATDYSTSPMTVRGGVIFGIGIGAITMCIRLWGAYPEGMSFAILVMNATVPLINRSVKPKRFGAKK